MFFLSSGNLFFLEEEMMSATLKSRLSGKISTNGTSEGGVVLPAKVRKKKGAADPSQDGEPARTTVKLRTVVIPKVAYDWVQVAIVGISPLYMNAFSHRVKMGILRDQQGLPPLPRAPRNLEQEYLEAAHWITPHTLAGFPAIGFKKAMCSAAWAANKTGGITGYFFLHGPFDGLVPILAQKPVMSLDMTKPRSMGGNANVAARPRFEPWESVLFIRHNKNLMPVDQVVNLVALAGPMVGIGAWRVEKKGDKGVFAIKAGPSSVLSLGEDLPVSEIDKMADKYVKAALKNLPKKPRGKK